MKSFVVVLALVALAAADVSHLKNAEAEAVVVEQSSDVEANKYAYGYRTSNGIFGQESGSIKNEGREDESLTVQGVNSYTDPNGQVVELSYEADEFGYRPRGLHLPTPPPTQAIPEYILRSIEYNRLNAPKEEQKY